MNFPALWRSALVPGWGQRYSGRPEAGRNYTYLFFGAAGLALIQSYRTSQARTQYSDNLRFLFLLATVLPGESKASTAGAPLGSGWQISLGLQAQEHDRLRQAGRLDFHLSYQEAF